MVVGDQSSGKSSLLESLTKIPFPRNLELCTRYATQITSRRDVESRVDIAIIPGPRASDAHKKHLKEYHPIMKSTKYFRTWFPEILTEVGFFSQFKSFSRPCIDNEAGQRANEDPERHFLE